MNRRAFLVQSAAAAALAATRSGGATAAPAAKRPNVLLLMSDEHKRSCMGAYGDALARTPNLDRLAGSSVRFTDAYCTNPVCTPSRASIMTGLHSHHLEAQNNALPYSPEHKTLAHHFDAANYMTGLVGKMHWVDAQTHGFEYHVEFNEWFQYLGPKTQLYADELGAPNSGSGLPQVDDFWRDSGDPWRGHRTRDDREGAVAVGRVSLLEEKDHFDNFVARESIRFLKNFGRGDRPFFLTASFLKPHDPFMPAERFARMFSPDDMRLPESWGKADLAKLPKEVQSAIKYNGPTPELRDPAAARKRLALYYANLAQMDDCVGQVLQAIRDLNLERDTIVCYTSDHGDMLGELGLWQKFQFYDGSCGIPLLIHVPGVTPGVCQTPVSLVSLCSTLTGAAGVPLLAPNDGASLAPWIHDPKTSRPYGPVFAEYGLRSKQPKYMIRDGRWKLTYWVHDIPELYDLQSDPQELHNRADDPLCKQTMADLRARLFAFHLPS